MNKTSERASSSEDLSLPVDARPRFIIVTDQPRCHEWEARSIRSTVASGFGTLAGVIYTRNNPSKLTVDQRLRRCFGLVERSSSMLMETEIDALAADLPTLDRRSCAEEGFEVETHDFVSAICPDFVLALGGSDSDLSPRLAALVRWGVWSYRFGESDSPFPQVAVLTAIQSERPTIQASLVMRKEETLTLHNGAVSTFLAKPSRTVDHLCSSISSWLRRACVDIVTNGFSASRFPEAQVKPTCQPGGTNISTFRVLAGMLKGFIKTQAHYRLSRQQWNVGVIHASISAVAGLYGPLAQAEALDSAQWMPEQRGQFFADPFGYECATGKIRILFEQFDWASGKGCIAMRDYDGRGFGAVRIVLEAKTHLSYPFLVNLDGQPHYIPEQAEARDVSAFILNENGQTIRKNSLMSDVELLDCTFIEWNEKFWMFALEDRPSKNTHLHLFYSRTMDGVWRPHSLNPIKTDVRNARPGGTPFVHNGRLFRPSQDCSTHYGRAIVINEILILTETDYAERPVSRVDPHLGSDYDFGLHTLSKVNGITLIDGARKTWKWSR